jgi:hypothetical protein
VNAPLKPLAGAALIAGAARIAAAFIPYVPDSIGLEALYAVIDLGMMFGLQGLAAVWGNAWNTLSVIGFGVALTGISLIIGPDPKMFGIDFYIAGSAVYLIGLSCISFLLLSQKRLQFPAIMWIVCFLTSLATFVTAIPLIPMIAGLALGLGFLGLGVQLLRQRAP